MLIGVYRMLLLAAKIICINVRSEIRVTAFLSWPKIINIENGHVEARENVQRARSGGRRAALSI